MKITCISDPHGRGFPEIEPSDLLLIGGDICPNFRAPARGLDRHTQVTWFCNVFWPWVRDLPVRKAIGVFGNHDWLGELADYESALRPFLAGGDQKLTMLTDEGYVFEGLQIYGMPWQKEFNNWAFNLTEEQLAEKYKAIPAWTDILITHGPPYGFGDVVKGQREHLGSPSLTEVIAKRNIKLVVTGHIHSASGVYQCGSTTVVNASLIDEDYKMVYPPRVIEL